MWHTRQLRIKLVVAVGAVSLGGRCQMRGLSFTLTYGTVLILGMAGSAVAQNNGEQQPSARQQLQHIHTPQSINQELARLTKDLELTPEQQKQVRPILDEHHD